MEEILASIRRIIADDDANKSPPPRSPEPPKAQSELAPPPEPVFSAPPAPPPRPGVEPEPLPMMEEPSPLDATNMADQASDILDLTESMAAAIPPLSPTNSLGSAMPNPVAQFRTIDGSSDVGFDEGGDRPAAAEEERGRLISNATSAAVDSAFNALAQTVLVQNARTLEDLVREMLRPMLKTWLDDNLPGTVERLVRAEIERVSRGRAS
ncbi:MAG: DUF2497 domain-containing protein [Xanthobacteraceae bacterium]